jgi:undecaprenyl pyrophosphate synthase
MIHLGIIPDGNRRYIKKNPEKNLINLWDEFFNKILNDYSKYENLKTINEISIYVCSIENIKREDNTKENIIDILNLVLNILNDNKYFINLININFIGDINLLPKDLQKLIEKTKSKFKGDKLKLNLAIVYDYNKDLENYNTNLNKNYNRKQSNIDLVLRSGQEKRLSGFFPTKTLYSELFFIDKLFPEVTLDDLDLIIQEFNKRNRRFGK